MNAIQFLKTQHEEAKRAFGEIQSAGANQRGQIWAKLEPELKMHEQIEETALYGPVAQDVGAKNQKLKDWQQHHHSEVTKAESMIQAIGRLDPNGNEWMNKVRELQQALEHHIQEEEGEIWPQIERAWDQSKLQQAGQQMESMKQTKTRAA